MAFKSLEEALSRLNMGEVALKELVQDQGVQVFMAANDAGKKSIFFKAEDLDRLERIVLGHEVSVVDDEPAAVADSSAVEMDLVDGENMDIDLDLGDGGPELDLGDGEPELDLGAKNSDLDLGLGGDQVTLDLDSESIDLDLDLGSDGGLSGEGADLDLDLGSDGGLSGEGADLDLGGDDARTLDLTVDDAVDVDLDLEVDETLDFGAGSSSSEETLSFDLDADETLSIGSENNLEEEIALPEESYSIEGDTIGVEETLGLDGDSEVEASPEEKADEEGEDRPVVSTTEIVDEDPVMVWWPILAFVCFGVVVFNGCVIFGLIQDMDVAGGIAYGESFYDGLRDFAKNTFKLPK